MKRRTFFKTSALSKQMKNILTTILFMIAFTLSFLLFPLIFEWIKTGTYAITTDKIKLAITLGVVVPLVMMLSKKIKNDFVYVGIALVFMFAAIFAMKFLLSQIL